MDADQRRRLRDRLGAAANLDGAWPPRIAAGEVVDDDRRPTACADVAELLGLLEVTAGDVDRVVLAVVGPPDRHDVRRAVGADSRDPAEAAPGVQVGQLGLREHAHLHGPHGGVRCFWCTVLIGRPPEIVCVTPSRSYVTISHIYVTMSTSS